MRNILVPTDFSQESEYALEFAIQFAQKIRAEVTVLNVIEMPSGSFTVAGGNYAGTVGMDSTYALQLKDISKERLTKFETKGADAGVKITTKLDYGKPYKQICKYSDEVDADMIVMGSKGVDGWEEALIGSNAEKVIRSSNIPVFTIKGETNLENIKNMVFAIGNSQDKSVAEVKSIQKIIRATCHLLKVYRPQDNSYTYTSANDEVEEFAIETEFKDYTTNVMQAPSPEEGILEFVKRNSIDMIAMGTHGYKGITHFLNGSTAEDVANHSNIPVLTIKVK